VDYLCPQSKIKLVSRPCVPPFVCPQKVCAIEVKFGVHVDKVDKCYMTHGQGHETLVRNSSIFKVYLHHHSHRELANDW